MRDGNWLSSSETHSVSLEMLVYNGVLKCFGYVSIAFDWSEAGTVDATMHVHGMAASSYADGQSNDMSRYAWRSTPACPEELHAC